MTIEEQFEAFHAANPHIMRRLVEIAWQAKAAGRNQMGIALLWERMRWDLFVESQGDEYKLNNNYRSHYARKIMADHPMLRGMFHTRELRAA